MNTKRYLSRRNFLEGASASAAALTFADCRTGAAGYDFVELPDDFIYLNRGTEGSMPECVMQRLNQYFSRWASNPRDSYETDEILGKRQPANRKSIERFLNADPNQVCLTDNTTMGLNLAIVGLSFSPGTRC